MLTRLWLKNFVLAESAEIAFQEGFNVITGETGSGKSIVLQSLSFVLGQKVESSIIRHGATEATVEATFELHRKNEAFQLLEEAGISIENETLIFKREIFENGRTRLFINHQSVTLTLVKKLTPLLIEFSGQHATTKLMEPETPSELLDLYGNLEEQKSHVRKLFYTVSDLQKKLTHLLETKLERERALATCLHEIEEIKSANLKEGEEEALFQEFSKLENANEIKTKAFELAQQFTESKAAIFPQLARLKSSFERLITLDDSLKEPFRNYAGALLELQEVGYQIKRYETSLRFEPERHGKIEARLKLINQLKRKFGNTIHEIMSYLDAQEKKVKELEQQEVSIETLQEECAAKKKELEHESKALSVQRKKIAPQLATKIEGEIRSLNMPHAIFQVLISEKAQAADGIDLIEFYFTPNLGETSINVEKASGGEMARLMLAFYSTLSSKTKVPTLFFDEIDANIGGTTASQVAEKMKQLGASHQIISITHFAQVARMADSHLVISKEERQGRTYTAIEALLSDTERLRELERMAGGIRR